MANDAQDVTAPSISKKKLLVYKKDSPPKHVLLASAEKFWGKVAKPPEDAPDGCWLWVSTLSQDGAALWLFGHERSSYRIPAYRAVLILMDVNVEPGDVVFRKCRNQLCVNPEHIGIGDHEDNVAARHKAGKTVRGTQNGRAKLTEENVSEIKLWLSRGAVNRDIADHFGVDKRAIWGIAAGKTWRHVPMAKEL
jgi:hypothetical protein